MAEAPAAEKFLTDHSPKDKGWDKHKFENVQVRQIYSASEFIKLAERMGDCANFLQYREAPNIETGEVLLKLFKAHFCRVRFCPICMWRKALTWRSRFFKAIPLIVEQNPTSRFIFLTLTVRNCSAEDIKETIKEMNSAWQRLIKRKEFRAVIGWVRATEVKRSEIGEAHPHFHVLLMVRPSYFGKDYVSQPEWVEAWREAGRLNYQPSVHVTTVKDKFKPGQTADQVADIPANAIMETLKYSTKPSDLISDGSFLLELTRQTKGLRFVAAGGLFKNVLKVESEITNEEMISLGDEKTDELSEKIISFLWSSVARRYVQSQHMMGVDPEMEEELKRKERIERFKKRSREL